MSEQSDPSNSRLTPGSESVTNDEKIKALTAQIEAMKIIQTREHAKFEDLCRRVAERAPGLLDGLPAPPTVTLGNKKGPMADAPPVVPMAAPLTPQTPPPRRLFAPNNYWLKLPEPSMYSGSKKQDDCFTWILSVKRYINALRDTGRIAQNDERIAITLVEMYTVGPAARWFDRETAKLKDGDPTAHITLEDMLNAFNKRFSRFDDDEKRRKEFETFK